MQWHISAVLNDAGQTTHYVAVQRDVTEDRRREQELRSARESAEAAARAKAEFLAVMSHEIRTPMNGVLGMTSILAETSLTPEQRDYLETIRSSGDALLSIINDILDFSKMEAVRLELEAVSFDLQEMAEVAADLVVPQGQDNGLEIILEIEPNLPRVMGDAGRLRQVLLNLLTNAIKFTPTGEIRLSIASQERSTDSISIHVTVFDTGIGILEETQQRLFSAFTQADSSTTRRYGGTGLGLAISQRIIQLMGGTIGLASTPELGSTFCFSLTLPLAASEPMPIAQSPAGNILQGKRALVVDDNATNREVLRLQLETAGLKMLEASSGIEALAMLTRCSDDHRAVDVALLDLHMPEIDGMMLARSIRSHRDWSNLPLVMLASHRDRESMLEARRANINEYLLKPVSSRKLLGMLDTLWRTSELPQLAPPVNRESYRGLVLVAEDNPVNQRIAKMMLERLGLRVDTVANGLEAIAALSRASYELILMDCQMPEMDGWAATRLIRQGERETQVRIPLVALTAAVLESDQECCREAGMDDFLSKPVTFADLQALVGKWLHPVSV